MEEVARLRAEIAELNKALTDQRALAARLEDRNQAEAIEARLTAVLEATTDLVGMADMAGRVAYLNRAGRQMVGLSDSEDPTAHNFNDAAGIRPGRKTADPGRSGT